MKKIYLSVFLFLIFSICMTRSAYAGNVQRTFWKYQCIDTMKTSRDRARSVPKEGNPRGVIVGELEMIKDLGGNCVAVGTPYDEEFIPYLKMWAEEAHKRNLTVWFRGNFSRWEGWYGYPKDLTPSDHLKLTEEFIKNHSDLFADGDAFDPCPECEGYGPWNVPEDNASYLQFRQLQVLTLDRLFANLRKKVITNRLSTIGGRARDVYDAETIRELRGMVTIDHYVENTEDMETYIRYFSDEFGAQTFVGEFGAPNPGINGEMDEDEQASFIESIFEVLYENRKDVSGINYWVLRDGTTSLLNPDGTYRKAAYIIKSFYKPSDFSFTITDSFGDPLEKVQINIGNGKEIIYSDSEGKANALMRGGEYVVVIEKENYEPTTLILSETEEADVILKREKEDIFYEIRSYWKRFMLLLRKKLKVG